MNRIEVVLIEAVSLLPPHVLAQSLGQRLTDYRAKHGRLPLVVLAPNSADSAWWMWLASCEGTIPAPAMSLEHRQESCKEGAGGSAGGVTTQRRAGGQVAQCDSQAQLRQKALSMRAEGHSLRAIGKALGLAHVEKIRRLVAAQR